MGGSDQWGNIVTGTELIRRKTGGEAFALTTRLITKADGTKFGKTEQGNVWLDAAKTSPYRFYQYWLNVADEDAAAYIRIFTLKTKEEIEALVAEHAQAPHLRKLQQALAADITIRVHSEEEYRKAVQASEILFGSATANELDAVDESLLLTALEGVPQARIARSTWEQHPTLTELLADLTGGIIFPSRGEARKMIQGGGVSINKQKITSPNEPLGVKLLHNRYLLAQKGKKNYYLIIVE
jgi:tyrosyl-tRNA synthetase